MAITLEKRNPINVVLIMVLLLAAGTAGYFYWSSTEAIKLRDQFSVRAQLAEGEKVKIVAELEKVKSELESYQKKVEGLTKEVAESQKDRQIAENDLKRKTDEISELQKRYEKRIQELENEVKQYADFNVILTKALAPIREALGNPATSGISNSVSTNPPVVSPSPSVFSVSAAAKPDTSMELATGQVLSIDREYGFIIVNFGSANGVKPSGLVQIYHHDQLLGIGQVERVQEKISAISIVNADLRTRIQNGDRVVLIS